MKLRSDLRGWEAKLREAIHILHGAVPTLSTHSSFFHLTSFLFFPYVCFYLNSWFASTPTSYQNTAISGISSYSPWGRNKKNPQSRFFKERFSIFHLTGAVWVMGSFGKSMTRNHIHRAPGDIVFRGPWLSLWDKYCSDFVVLVRYTYVVSGHRFLNTPSLGRLPKISGKFKLNLKWNCSTQ